MSDARVIYDLLLRGGHVIDPANRIDAPLDVALAEGKVAAVAARIAPEQARKTVPVAGLYVVPGLIDLHMHAFGYKGSLKPDSHTLPNGVTTAVDAGGAGWRTFERFRAEITHYRTRMLALLNIVGEGMVEEHEQDVEGMDPTAAAEMVRRYPDLLVGVKVAHYFGPGWEAVDRAVEAGALSGTPIMVDSWCSRGRTYEDLYLKHLRPGDIHTHVYARQFPMLDGQGRVRDCVWEGRRRGVLFDVGHGSGSIWFRIAAPAMAQGLWPDTISTDLHTESVLRPNAELLATLSKFLNLGLPLTEAIARVTVRPAAAIRRPQLGSLSVGAEADVAVLRLEQGEFSFVDSGLARLHGTQRLQCLLTIRGGKAVWDPGGLTSVDWEAAGQYEFVE